VNVLLRNPRRDTLVTHDARLADDDRVEIRPVISGGAG
jgi:molybdopterin converting factor small subunit